MLGFGPQGLGRCGVSQSPRVLSVSAVGFRVLALHFTSVLLVCVCVCVCVCVHEDRCNGACAMNMLFNTSACECNYSLVRCKGVLLNRMTIWRLTSLGMVVSLTNLAKISDISSSTTTPSSSSSI